MEEMSNVEVGVNDVQDVISDLIAPDHGMSNEEVLEMLEQVSDWIDDLIEGIEEDMAAAEFDAQTE